MARALTAGELVNLRKDGQHCALYLAVQSPSSVFTARVNGAPSSNDKVVSLTYDGGSAGFANAIAGQTVYVGSSAGAYDKGMVRLRGTLSGTTGTMKIGETSEINFANNDYLTVVDEFSIWPRHVYIDSNETIYMDYDIEYTSQHKDCNPTPVLGPPAVAWLNTSGEATIGFDASDSFCVGSSVSSYSWSASSGSWDDDTSATPTLTVTATGTHRISCVVTGANAKTTTAHRYIFVYDEYNNTMPTTAFTLDSCSGSWTSGGWAYRITMYDEAQTSEIRDRALVVLFARDYYGSTQTSIGPVSDRENIVCVGWVDGESIEWNPEQGTVVFTVQGPHFWFDKIVGFPAGVEDYAGDPTDWTEFNNLTVDRGLWHFLHWRSTATKMMDIYLTDDTRQVAQLEGAVGPLWQQLKTMAHGSILAEPCCDRYGRLFIEIDSNLLPVADRASITTVHTIATQDWRVPVRIERETIGETSRVDLSGIYYLNAAASAYFSLAPGHIFKNHGGGVDMRDHLALSSQAQANTLAALILAKANNEYPEIDIPLASNHRGFDICPQQYGVIDITATDTERGITESSLKIIPRRVTFRHDPQAGTLLTDIMCEGYTSPGTSSNGDPPGEPPAYPPPEYPPTPWVPTIPLGESYEAVCTGLSAGAWYTPDGTSWTDVSGSAGSGVSGYDIKVSRATRGLLRTSQVVWWVANNTVYYSSDGMGSVAEKAIGGPATKAWAVGPDPTDASTAYVLAANDANDQVWLYKTTTAGSSWSSVELVPAFPLVSDYSVDSEGHTNHIDVSASGTYCYVSILIDGSPALLRVSADLITYSELWTGGNSTGGVRCDPSTDATMYYFGDFHGYYIKKSLNNGDTLSNLYVAGASFISVLLINESDTDDLVAFDKNTLDLHVSRNGGTDWTPDVAALPFPSYAGARGNSDASLIWCGRSATDPDNLQLSEDTGATFSAANTGITANVEISSISVMWA